MDRVKRLLIINDEPSMLNQMERWLSDADYHVESTLYGKEGVELAQQEQFDLIVLDFNLKKETEGEKTAKAFIPQFIAANPSTPIIVVSATNGSITVEELGVSNVLIVDSTFWRKLLDLVKETLNN